MESGQTAARRSPGGAMSGADGRGPIVVGVDPDPSKRLAVAWAADEADQRALPLRLVHVRGVLVGGYRSGEARPPGSSGAKRCNPFVRGRTCRGRQTARRLS